MSREYTAANLPPELRAFVVRSHGADEYTKKVVDAYMWYGPNRELVVTSMATLPQYRVLPRGAIMVPIVLPYGIPHTSALSKFTFSNELEVMIDQSCGGFGIVRGHVIVHSRAMTPRQRRLYGVTNPRESLIWMFHKTSFYLLDVAGAIPQGARVVAQKHPRPTRTQRRYRDCGDESAVLSNVMYICGHVVIVRRRARSRCAYHITTWNPKTRMATQWKLGADVHPRLFSAHIRRDM